MLTGSVSQAEERDIYARMQRSSGEDEEIRVRWLRRGNSLTSQLCYVTVRLHRSDSLAFIVA